MRLRRAVKIISKPRDRSAVLLLIGAFKLLKAIGLVAIGIGAIRYLHRDLGTAVVHWTQTLGFDPDNRFIHAFLEKAFRVTSRQLREISAGTFLYGSLFATEGVGLLMGKRWAEYFTIVTTSLLLPIEVFELVHRLTVTRTLVLAVNIAIVWYLARRVRRA